MTTRNEEEERRLVIKMVKMLTSMAESQKQIVCLLEVIVDKIQESETR